MFWSYQPLSSQSKDRLILPKALTFSSSSPIFLAITGAVPLEEILRTVTDFFIITDALYLTFQRYFVTHFIYVIVILCIILVRIITVLLSTILVVSKMCQKILLSFMFHPHHQRTRTLKATPWGGRALVIACHCIVKVHLDGAILQKKMRLRLRAIEEPSISSSPYSSLDHSTFSICSV